MIPGTGGQSSQEYFRLILLTVVGQAFNAAGYFLEDHPTHWAGGLYRFSSPLSDGLRGFIDFQHLHYVEPEASSFSVYLTRTDKLTATQPSAHPRFARRSLSALVVTDFGVAILPSPDHWWQYRDVTELGGGLAEAGHLVVGYGIPWLAGELSPRPGGASG
jgi:hypothetical protein